MHVTNHWDMTIFQSRLCHSESISDPTPTKWQWLITVIIVSVSAFDNCCHNSEGEGCTAVLS